MSFAPTFSASSAGSFNFKMRSNGLNVAWRTVLLSSLLKMFTHHFYTNKCESQMVASYNQKTKKQRPVVLTYDNLQRVFSDALANMANIIVHKVKCACAGFSHLTVLAINFQAIINKARNTLLFVKQKA